MKDYNKHDHTHCFNQKESPCGIKGIHRCCLCLEPSPQPSKLLDDLLNSPPHTMQEEIKNILIGLLLLVTIYGFSALVGSDFWHLLTFYCFWGVFYQQIKD